MNILIIGRPNVGKSTLFNYWVGHRLAIESQIAGTTRDFIEQEIEIDNYKINLIDTAGFEEATDNKLLQIAFTKTRELMNKTDTILFLVSSEDGLTPLDEQVAKFLRKTKIPLIFAATKADNSKRREIAQTDFWKLGLGAPLAFSVKQKSGIQDLEKSILQAVNNSSQLIDIQKDSTKILDFQSSENFLTNTQHPIRFALIGRPNVGKSTLFNQLTKQDRAIVSDIPGTTRDLIEINFTVDNEELKSRSVDKKSSSIEIPTSQIFTIVDTAGLRRPGKRKDSLEFFSVDRTNKVIDHVDIVGIVIDVHEGLTKLDLALAQKIIKAGRALFFIANKWDLLDPDQKEHWQKFLPVDLQKFVQAPIITTSALTGSRTKNIVKTVFNLYTRLHFRLLTSQLNKFFTDESTILFIAQKGENPPLFDVSIRGSKPPHFSFRRHLENRLRQKFDLRGLPIRWTWKIKEARGKRKK